MISLQEREWKRLGNGPMEFIHIKQSLPFVENPRGLLIHRPRAASVRVWPGGRWPSYIVVHCWCGTAFTKKTTFVADVPDGSLLCKRCEDLAVRSGLPSASEITGHHVCVGGVRAYNACHIHGERQ